MGQQHSKSHLGVFLQQVRRVHRWAGRRKEKRTRGSACYLSETTSCHLHVFKKRKTRNHQKALWLPVLTAAAGRHSPWAENKGNQGAPTSADPQALPSQAASPGLRLCGLTSLRELASAVPSRWDSDPGEPWRGLEAGEEKAREFTPVLFTYPLGRGFLGDGHGREEVLVHS